MFPRRTLLMLSLLLAAALSYTFAFLLSFEFVIPSPMQGVFRLGLCIFVLTKGIVFWDVPAPCEPMAPGRCIRFVSDHPCESHCVGSGRFRDGR